MICISWNVCGLGNDQTQNALETLCTTHKPDWISIYEPKILPNQLPRQFLRKLNLTLVAINERPCSRPNIWVLCRPHITTSDQHIATSDQHIAIKSADISFAFVHASNSYTKRRQLWIDLININEPRLCIMGDFNVVLGAHERSSGIIGHASSTTDF